MEPRAIKAVGEYELEVLGVPFYGPHGNKDYHGEFFDANTNVYADLYGTVPAVVYHGGYDRKPIVIGKATYVRQDERGHWYRVVLDPSKAQSAELMQAAKEGKAFGSSDSVAHLVRKVMGNKIVDQLGRVISSLVSGLREGQILDWPAVALSLLDLRKGQEPANMYAVAMPALKSVYDQAGLRLPVDLELDPETAEAAAAKAAQRGGERERKPNPNGDNEMETEEQKLAAAKAAGRKELEAELAAKAEQEKKTQEAADQAVAAAKAVWEEENKEILEAGKEVAIKGRRLNDEIPTGVNQSQFQFTHPYDDLEPGDHALLVGVLDAAKQSGKSKGGASENAVKALAIKLVDEASRDKDRRYTRPVSAMKAAGMPLKANELNQSTLANYGDEWVGVAYSNELWEKIRLGVEVVGKIPTVVIPQGAESVPIPLDGASPTFYKVAQASAQASDNLGAVVNTVPTSKKGTGQQVLTAAKLGAATIWTGEMEEDSMIPWIEELRADLVKEGQEVLEHAVIDGDTETGATTNINDIGGTPAGTEAFMLFDGFRKLALVTNAANSRDAGAFTVSDFLATMKLLGLAGRNAMQKDKAAFIVDAWTHWAALELAEVKTKDVFVAPTIEQGQLKGLWGYQVIASANMHRANQDATYGLKANAAGKVDLDTASNNSKGAILAVRWDQWRLGFKRRMTIETTRIPRADATEIVALMRVGLKYRDTEASAISYNLTV